MIQNTEKKYDVAQNCANYDKATQEWPIMTPSA